MAADQVRKLHMQASPGCISLEEDEEVCGSVPRLCERQLGVDLGQRIGKLAQIDAAVMVSIRQREQLVQTALHIGTPPVVVSQGSTCLQL